MKVEALRPINHDGVDYKESDTLDVSDAQARDLVEVGAARVAKTTGKPSTEEEGAAKAATTLQDAQDKAKQIVADATEEAAKIKAAAEEEGDKARADAQADAEKLRQDAADSVAADQKVKTDDQKPADKPDATKTPAAENKPGALKGSTGDTK